jgi:thiosulfate/3-mercaptopyruvate sulfurtransferase
MLVLAGLLLWSSVHDTMVVSPEWVAQHLNARNVIVVEVGDREEYEREHIPGARLLDRDDFIVWANGLPDELPPVERLEAVFTRLGIGNRGRIVLYSREPLLATRAWFTLDVLQQGHRTSILDGGWDAWVQQGRPVSTARVSWSARPFTADLNPVGRATADWVRSLVRTRAQLRVPVRFIDARPPIEYTGAEPGRDIDRGGHIPDAVCIPWRANLTADGTLRAEAELRQIYATAGVDKNAVTIAYCRTGVEASMTYFVLRYLGYDVALYDGSFYDWSRGSTTAVHQ